MYRAVVLVGLLLLIVACSAAPPSESLPQTPAPAPPAASPTTIVMVVTVPPIPTFERPTQPPAPVLPTPTPAPENPFKLTSDGVLSPPGFRLVGGDYLFSWEVVPATKPAGCYFGAVLTSEPSVSPFTFQTLGPWTVDSGAGHTGSRRLNGLGAGAYTLRPNGDCPWTVTVTPVRGR
jgi:hypothetical protein